MLATFLTNCYRKIDIDGVFEITPEISDSDRARRYRYSDRITDPEPPLSDETIKKKNVAKFVFVNTEIFTSTPRMALGSSVLWPRKFASRRYYNAVVFFIFFFFFAGKAKKFFLTRR